MREELKDHVLAKMMPLVLPWHLRDVERVVFVNTTIKFRSDITDLFQRFERFQRTQVKRTVPFPTILAKETQRFPQLRLIRHPIGRAWTNEEAFCELFAKAFIVKTHPQEHDTTRNSHIFQTIGRFFFQ